MGTQTQPRFKVATIEGDLTQRPCKSRVPFGLSAHVLDTLYCHRVVKTFRSEDKFSTGHTRGRSGALKDAEHWAETLNAAE